MSKIFYDYLITLNDVDTEIKNISQTEEEKEELWKLVDDIVHHRVMLRILDNLPLEHHVEFLDNFHKAPHHESHIGYLNQRLESVEENIEDHIKTEIQQLEKELLHEIRSLKGK